MTNTNVIRIQKVGNKWGVWEDSNTCPTTFEEAKDTNASDTWSEAECEITAIMCADSMEDQKAMIGNNIGCGIVVMSTDWKPRECCC